MRQYHNDNEITINYIIDFIKDELYIDNEDEEIDYKYFYFKPNKNEYNKIGNNYINILNEKFKESSIIDNNIINITYNDLFFRIEYRIDNNNIGYWCITISNTSDIIFT